jgi:hypothetical protein
MKAAIQVLLIAAGSLLVYPNAIAQPKPLSPAYQVTYVDNATPTFSPDGKRMILESVTDGKEHVDWTRDFQIFAASTDSSQSQ